MIKRIAILASGNGSNAEQIVSHFEDSNIAKVSVILTNNAGAGIVERAARLGISLIAISKNDLESKILLILQEKNIDFLVLAGFLLKIPLSLIQAYTNRILNIHPSLLPKFGGKGMYGLHVHEAVIAAKELESGITIHCINEEYDKGIILGQFSLPVKESDTAEMLQKRIMQLEHKYYPIIIEHYIKSCILDE
ncbi:MAG: phosphoribosylglycinamide formyltransferase [Bacteroidales bacterium]